MHRCSKRRETRSLIGFMRVSAGCLVFLAVCPAQAFSGEFDAVGVVDKVVYDFGDAGGIADLISRDTWRIGIHGADCGVFSEGRMRVVAVCQTSGVGFSSRPHRSRLRTDVARELTFARFRWRGNQVSRVTELEFWWLKGSFHRHGCILCVLFVLFI